jgi:hypothetical protein
MLYVIVHAFFTNSGSLAIFTAMRLASSLLSNLAAERRAAANYDSQDVIFKTRPFPIPS